MTRSDRSWTAAIAECGLDRARPLLARLVPEPFERVDLARALAATGLVPERGMSFAEQLRPGLEETLGFEAEAALAALGRLPLDQVACPATVFWRGMFRDLNGVSRPDLPSAAAAYWTAFTDAFRGRAAPDEAAPDWLNRVAEDAQAHREFTALVKAQRALPLTALDRSIYVRFGWNDDGEIPGLAGLLDAAALLRTQRAWAAVAGQFDVQSQDAIQSAAGRLAEAERMAAMATLDHDARRYGVLRSRLAAALYPPRLVPPLNDILAEAS